MSIYLWWWSWEKLSRLYKGSDLLVGWECDRIPWEDVLFRYKLLSDTNDSSWKNNHWLLTGSWVYENNWITLTKWNYITCYNPWKLNTCTLSIYMKVNNFVAWNTSSSPRWYYYYFWWRYEWYDNWCWPCIQINFTWSNLTTFSSNWAFRWISKPPSAIEYPITEQQIKSSRTNVILTYNNWTTKLYINWSKINQSSWSWWNYWWNYPIYINNFYNWRWNDASFADAILSNKEWSDDEVAYYISKTKWFYWIS